MDYSIPYLTSNLLPYIGGKESSLPFISEQIDKIIEKDKNLQNLEPNQVLTFVDLFSGSGAVSRLAKLKGFKVISNDLEIYSKIITEVSIRYTHEQVVEFFAPVCEKLGLSIEKNAYLAVIDYLNALKKVKYPKNNYFSLKFAPKDTKHIDKHSERLYYTQENAAKIDAIIETIFNNRLFNKEAREIVLASLVVSILNVVNNEKMLTRSFSPKFRAKNERVLSELMLKPFSFITNKGLSTLNPALLLPENQCESYRGYAEVFTNKVHFDGVYDFVYLDPPFQQQQYSTNYSHLISACENDKQEVEDIENKKFQSRPSDLLNESKFCKKAKLRGEKLAEISLRRTFESVNAKYILFSYCANTVLTIPEIIRIFSENGKNHISVAFEFNEREDLIEIERQNKIQHSLFIIQKNFWQSKEEVDLLIRELKSKSVIAENETFAIGNKLIDIFSLVEQNSDNGWYYIENNVVEKYRLFHNDTFLFEVNFDLEIQSNIDTDFTKEQIAVIGKHFISEKQAKRILENKEGDVLLNYQSSSLVKTEEIIETSDDLTVNTVEREAEAEPEEELMSYLDSTTVVKEETDQQMGETVDDLMARLEQSLSQGKLNSSQQQELRSLFADSF